MNRRFGLGSIVLFVVVFEIFLFSVAGEVIAEDPCAGYPNCVNDGASVAFFQYNPDLGICEKVFTNTSAEFAKSQPSLKNKLLTCERANNMDGAAVSETDIPSLCRTHKVETSSGYGSTDERYQAYFTKYAIPSIMDACFHNFALALRSPEVCRKIQEEWELNSCVEDVTSVLDL